MLNGRQDSGAVPDASTIITWRVKMLWNFFMKFDWIRIRLERIEKDRVKYLGK